jgi:hypothetical protein
VDSQLSGIAQPIALAGGMIPLREKAGLLRRRPIDSEFLENHCGGAE